MANDTLDYNYTEGAVAPVRRQTVGSCIDSGVWPEEMQPVADIVVMAMQNRLPTRKVKWKTQDGSNHGTRDQDLNSLLYSFADRAMVAIDRGEFRQANEFVRQIRRYYDEAYPVIQAAHAADSCRRALALAEKEHERAHDAWERSARPIILEHSI